MQEGAIKPNILLALLVFFPFCGQAVAQNHPGTSESELPQQPNEVRNSSVIFPGNSWKHLSSLERSGWSREKLDAARQYADSIHSSAVMIVQCGEVVDQWGDIDKKISGYSIRKPDQCALWHLCRRRRYRH